VKDNTFFVGLRVASVILAVTLMAANLCAAVQENVLHSFSNNGRDGSSPLGGLIFDSLGNLYGTTRYGGSDNSGAVFELMPKAGGGWSEKILYSFIDNNKDGVGPYASVVFDAKGNLYGTTCYGGTYGDGIVFELLPRARGPWTEKVLHTFNGTDGGCSFAPLIFDANGNLFGTAYDGGAYGSGIVFELTPSARGGWKEKVLYNFRQTGGYPQNGLTFDSSGNLYGTAHGGNGAGVVFKLTPKAGGGWTESVIHSFHGKDGYDPEALIIDAAGNLYGTTYVGGSSGDGNVFELSPKAGGGWTVKVLHSFSGKDGVFCYAGVVFDNAGNLYGALVEGGTYNHGTVFELMPKPDGHWTEKTLHSFNDKDGTYPWAPVLVDAAGDVYGVTEAGGATGYGTVFEIKP
jgi:uncharacterized repeat protein (TIGR03803 family)